MIRSENRYFIHDRIIKINLKFYIKILYSWIRSSYYFAVLCLKNKATISDRKYNVSVCAIFKNEGESLKEWIDYHMIVGIQHFYLYNNFSTDDYIKILEPYIKMNMVTLVDWPIVKGQVRAYEDCFNKRKTETQWLFFIDIDEFICPKKETNVSNWLTKYKKYSSIVIYWKMFGTSGILEHDSSIPTIEQYVNSWEKQIDIGKTVVNTNFDVFDFSDFHKLSTQIYLLGKRVVIPPVNEFRKFICFGYNRVGRKNIADSRIQINHYWSKSYKSYVISKSERGPGTTNTIRDLSYMYLNETKNISTDYTIWRFLIKLKTGEAERMLKS